jgi:lysozyme family protein
MASSSFGEAMSRVLAEEGGYADHPRDPGGPTRFGITLAVARRHWKADATAADMRALPLDVAKDIYRARYWDALRCDDLPAGVDLATFDYGVNSGVSRAGRVLRRALGLPDRPAAVTDEVIAASARIAAADLVVAICDERLAFLKALRTWPTFGRGWERRVARIRAAALALCRGNVGVARRGRQRAATAVAVGAGMGAAAAASAAPSWGGPVAILLAVTAAGALAVWLWRLRRRRAAAPSSLPSQEAHRHELG